VVQLGGDPEQLARLRTTLVQQSQVIESLTGEIRRQLGDTNWHGPAAERFRGAWASDFEPALRRLQGALQEAGEEVGRHREALLRAGG
jgi:WXG100 family type VII secretion target